MNFNLNLNSSAIRVLKYALFLVGGTIALLLGVMLFVVVFDAVVETTVVIEETPVTYAECSSDPISSWSIKTPTCNIHVVDAEANFELFARIRDDNKHATLMINGEIVQVPVCNGWNENPACDNLHAPVKVERGQVVHTQDIGCTTIEPNFSEYEYGDRILIKVKDKIILTNDLPEQFTPMAHGPHAREEGL